MATSARKAATRANQIAFLRKEALPVQGRAQCKRQVHK
jgi:hypothetical protein